MDGFAKFPIFVRPTLESCLQQGITPHFCYASIASWYVYARRSMHSEVGIPYHEPNWHLLAPMLAPGAEMQFATSSLLWGDLSTMYPEFAGDIVQSIQEMDQKWPV